LAKNEEQILALERTTGLFSAENGEPFNGELAFFALSDPHIATPNPGLLLSLTTHNL